MRVLLPGLLIFAAYAIFARWYYICEVRQLCAEEPVVATPDRLKTLGLKDGDTLVLSGFDQFLFKKDSIRPTLNDNNRQFIEAVAAYFQEYPGKDLTITGRTLTSEADTKASFFDYIGIARAAQLELLLEEAGMVGARISLDHEMVEQDSLLEPLSFEAYLPFDEDYEKLQYNFLDMTYSEANFAYNSAEFLPKQGFLAYADSMMTFIDQNPTFHLLITGHTDSIASQDYNAGLGLRRAEAAQAWLVDKGLTKDRIQVATMGETEPVAPNSTPDGRDNPEGRQKNRRVNFKLKSQEVE